MLSTAHLLGGKHKSMNKLGNEWMDHINPAGLRCLTILQRWKSSVPHFPLDLYIVSFQKADYLLLHVASIHTSSVALHVYNGPLILEKQGHLRDCSWQSWFLIEIQGMASSLSHHYTVFFYCLIKSQQEQLPGLWEKGVKGPNRCDTCSVGSVLILSL